MLIRKFSPEFEEKGMMYSEKSFHRVTILKMRVDRYSGKSKRIG